MRTRVILYWCIAQLFWALPSTAATVRGLVTDGTGAALPERARRAARRGHRAGGPGQTGPDGRYELTTPAAGTYLVVVTRARVLRSRAHRRRSTPPTQTLDVPVVLELGSLTTGVSVTAARAEREIRQIPLHVETMTRRGDRAGQPALHRRRAGRRRQHHAGRQRPVRRAAAAARPRLDAPARARRRRAAEHRAPGDRSHRRRSRPHLHRRRAAGWRSSTAPARCSTDRTRWPARSTSSPTSRRSRRRTQWLYGFNGFYSSNEDGRRGTRHARRDGAALRRSASRAAPRTSTTTRAGDLDVEDTRPFFASGSSTGATPSTTTSASRFNAFPDPFNAPYVRTDNAVPNSQAEGNFVNASGLVELGENRRLRVRYQRRRMDDVGFADFAHPYFFNATSLPHSNLDRVSARYEAQAVTPWLANLSLTAYYQRTERLLQQPLPVQFPAPTPVAFFPISVMRLDIAVGDRAARVDARRRRAGRVRAGGEPPAHDRGSRSTATAAATSARTTTTTSMVGQVVLGAAWSGAGRASRRRCARAAVDRASGARARRGLRDVAVFAQDEWRRARRSCRSSAVCAATSTTSRPRRRPATTWRRSWPARAAPIDPATLPTRAARASRATR